MAKNLQYARDFNPYGRGVTVEELQRVRRQLAKVMNQRMKRLETAKSPVTGEALTFGSYEKMQDYLAWTVRTTNKAGIGVRFSENLNPKMSAKELRAEIRALQGFESQVSSRVGGMKQIENKRIETFKAKGLDPAVVSNKSFYDFLNSETFRKLRETFDSDKIIEEYNKTAKEGVKLEEITQALDTWMDKTKTLNLKGMRQKLRATTIKSKSVRRRSKKVK